LEIREVRMNQQSIRRSLALFFLMRVAGAGVMLTIPVLIPFYRSKEVDLWGVALAEFIFGVTALALDVPTGKFADTLGRRRSLLVGRIALTLGFAVYALAQSLGHFIVAEILLAVGFAFSIGADEAFMRSLFPRTEEGAQRFARVWSITVVVDLVSGAGAMFLGPLLFQQRKELPFEVASVAYLASAALVFCMREPALPRRSAVSMRSVARFCLHERPEVRSLIMFQASLWTLLGAMGFLYEPYFRHLGIDPLQDGPIFALLGVASGVASYAAPGIGARLGRQAIQWLLAGLLVLAPLVLGLWTSAVVVLFLLIPFCVRGMLPVVVGVPFNAAVPEEMRATAISVRSMCTRIGDCFGKTTGLLLAGWIGVADTFLILSALGIGVVFVRVLITLRPEMNKARSEPEASSLGAHEPPAAERTKAA